MRSLPYLVLCLAAALQPQAQAAAAETPQRTEDLIRARFRERFPELIVRSVGSSPWPGVYEVVAADGIVYTDASADHAISGSIIDTRSKQNLTELSWNAANRIDFRTLPLARAIKVVRGDGSRVLAVFADPDCPYCRKLEQTLQGMTNLSVYTFLFPIAELHPEATRHARQIWCAADAPASWSAWMSERQPPATAGQAEGCANEPLAELAALGATLHINGTPTMFMADGTRLRGAIEREELEQHLAAVSVEANRLAVQPAAATAKR